MRGFPELPRPREAQNDTSGHDTDDGRVTAALLEVPTSPSPAGPPTSRRGRHRDKALASWRRSEAVRLKAAGLSYEQIARELGYANRGTVHRVVQQALSAREAESVDELRHLELARLDAVQAALWPRAMAGEVSAALGVLRVLDQRLRLLGLDRTTGTGRAGRAWPSCHGPATVVVHPDDCRHEGCPRHGKFTSGT